jgi:flavin reductase (DIM6/NTAB) family NADH-FMN oxidoreductase RutF
MTAPHVVSEPNILYFGTPVVLVSTVNDDGTANLAPMSSAFWLRWRCVLGLATASMTTQNIIRTGECALNLPSPSEVKSVDRIARTTGSNPVPKSKEAKGYVYEPNKFGLAGMTQVESQTVAAPRALECPIQLEAVMAARHGLAEDTAEWRGRTSILEMRIQRVHVHPDLLMEGNPNRIDPDKWSPLIMSFQKFYGLAMGQVHGSRVADIPEQAYRSPDVDRARALTGVGASVD